MKTIPKVSQTNNFLFKSLNNEQLQAVKHVYGPLLVVAGAGSGKTKALTHRIANLIEIWFYFSGKKFFIRTISTFTLE